MRKTLDLACHALACRLAAVLSVAALGMGISVAAPGDAQGSLGECMDGQFCGWEHANYNDMLVANRGDDSNWHDNGVGDRVSSVFNDGMPHTFDAVRAYRHINYGGANICFPRGRAESNLRGHFWREGWRAGNWNDDISSHRWVASC